VRIALPIIVAVALAVYAFIDCGQTDRDRVRPLSKPLWMLVILVPILGPVAWLVLGRPKPQPASGQRPAKPQRPVAPDDDPEFLRQIRNIDEEHKEMLREWEDNLRRREQHLRDDDEPDSKRSDKKRSDSDGDPASKRDDVDRRNGPEIDPSDGDTR